MRANPTKSFVRLGLCLAVLGVPAAGFLACADALHLDPPGTGIVGTGGSKGDGGTTTCRSNPDCTYPAPVCNTVTASCVECLVISDCAGKPGTVCSGGVCNCPNPANPAMPLTYCGNATPACVDTTTSLDNCGTCGNACFACTAGKCGNAWVPTATTGAPAARTNHVAVWTGSQMFVWGGKDAGGNPLASGGLYNPTTKAWTPTTATGAPGARYDTTAVWDDVDKVVLVWGGRTAASAYAGDGFKYDPAKDAWSPLCPTGPAPAARADHTAVWVNPLSGITGSTAGLIVWGGRAAAGTVADGAICDPTAATNAWVAAIPVPVPATNAPSARALHIATWDSGARMIVFGGTIGGAMPQGDTWGYTPSAPPAMWNANSNTNPLGKRYQHTGVWDAASATTIVFGGWDGTSYFGDAAALNGTTWASLGAGSTNPPGRINHSAVLLTKGTTSQLAVFGGEDATGPLGDGWTLGTTASGTWAALPAPGPSARTHHTAVTTGTTMIVWGGTTATGPTNTGGVYTAM